MEVNHYNIREHTLLITEKCPLACKYCYLEKDKLSSQSLRTDFTYEEIEQKVSKYVGQDLKEGFVTQILFTGGEPFVYWDHIHKIMIKFPTIRYHFNTSGFLFTQEILEELSNYNVHFTLSVDGDEKLTNYLRRNKTNKYGIGYMKKFKEICPSLLYYFPETPFKMIISPRYVDKVYETYLFAERLGFKSFNLFMDFNCRTYDPSPIKTPMWTEDDTEELAKQLDLIGLEILMGWKIGVERMHVTNCDNILSWLLSNNEFDLYKYPCQVFNKRSLSSIFGEEEGHCLEQWFDSLDEAKEALLKEYNNNDGKCPKDPNCECFPYCANNNCIANALKQYYKFFEIEDQECIFNKVAFNMIMKVVAIANEECPNSLPYQLYLRGLKEVR